MAKRDEFWIESDRTFTNPAAVSQRMVQNAERSLGYTLPASYVRLIKTRNGGTPRRAWFPLHSRARTEDDCVQIRGICGLGGKWGIDSKKLGSQFMIREWGYPDVGIVVCQCPSAGHDAVMLDYSQCGRQGEPRVIHVETESEEGAAVTPLAKDFATFLEGLVGEEALEDVPEEEVAPDIYRTSREVATEIVQSRGLGGQQPTDLSDLGFDIVFWLHTNALDVPTQADLLRDFPRILVGFGGDATSLRKPLLQDWLSRRLQEGAIVLRESERTAGTCLAFTDKQVKSVTRRVVRRAGAR